MIASLAPINGSISIQLENFAIRSATVPENATSMTFEVELPTAVGNVTDFRQSASNGERISPAFSLQLTEEVLDFYRNTTNSSDELRLFNVVYGVDSPLFQEEGSNTGSIIVGVGQAFGPAPLNLTTELELSFEAVKV